MNNVSQVCFSSLNDLQILIFNFNVKFHRLSKTEDSIDRNYNSMHASFLLAHLCVFLINYQVSVTSWRRWRNLSEETMLYNALLL